MALLLAFSGLVVLWVPSPTQAAAPSLVGATSTHTSDVEVSSITLTKPSAASTGDLLLAVVIAEKGSDLTITAPNGWTPLRRTNEGTNLAQSVYFRFATGASSYQWTFSQPVKAAGAVVAYSGTDPTTPVAASSGHSEAGSIEIVASALTTTTSDTILVGFFGVEKETSVTPPTGMTELFDTEGLAGVNNVNVAAAEVVVATVGDTGDKVATPAQGAKNIGQLVAVNPPGAPPSTGSADRASGFQSSGSSVTTFSIPTPTTVGAGDLMLAVVAADGGSTLTMTPPSGWTLVRRDDQGAAFSQAIYYRVATASEPTTYAWTFGTGAIAAGGMLSYVGVDTTTPVAASSGQGRPTSMSITAPGVTTSGTDAIVVGFYGIARYSRITPPTGLTERFDTSDFGSNSVNVAGTDMFQATAGPTGDRTATVEHNAEGVGQLVALRTLPRIQFQSSASSGDESVAAPSLTVSLTRTSTADASATYTVTAGTATSGSDFTASSGTVTVVAGQMTATFALGILDDQYSEADETVVVTLSAPSGASLGTVLIHTYTILDADPPVVADAWPVSSSGATQTGASWGAWQADPGTADVPAANYLKITNWGPAGQAFTVDFSDGAFAGSPDTSSSVPINANLQFAWWQDTSPSVTAPSEGTFAWLAASGTGTLAATFGATGNIVYVTYRLASVPDLVADQPYQASYTVEAW